MGRGMQIAVLCAVAVGSVGGGVVALNVSSNEATAPTASSPSPAHPPARPDPSPAPTEAAATDPGTVLGALMKTVFGRFVAWSRDHAGAPCPDIATLGVVALDPWGHAIELTCTDQPADQRIGAVSAGPDGLAGSGDDIASWTLGREVTDLVRGPRWRPDPTTASAPAVRPFAGRRHRDAAAARERGSAAQVEAGSSARPPATPASSTAPRSPSGGESGSDDIPSRR
ncbi:MAG TPA: hypothetical protein VFT22_24610 [Kofleriaceae bacterium]|nr:hypothetical protein [Kofleriaceae bacterium]